MLVNASIVGVTKCVAAAVFWRGRREALIHQSRQWPRLIDVYLFIYIPLFLSWNIIADYVMFGPGMLITAPTFWAAAVLSELEND